MTPVILIDDSAHGHLFNMVIPHTLSKIFTSVK